MKITTLLEMSPEDQDLNKTPPIGKIGNFVTSAQAAKTLGVTMSRIRQMVMSGELKSYRPEKGRRDHLFKLSELNKIKKKKQKEEKDKEKDE